MKPESIRLWLTEGKDDDKDKLAESFKKISESEQRMEVDNGSASASGSTEGKSKTQTSFQRPLTTRFRASYFHRSYRLETFKSL